MIRPARPVPDRKRLDEELRLSCPSTPERQQPGRPARLGTPEGAANQPTQRSCLSSGPPYYVPVGYVSLRALQKGFHGASAHRFGGSEFPMRAAVQPATLTSRATSILRSDQPSRESFGGDVPP